MLTNTRKICVVTGSRADYGLLKTVITKINMSSDLSLCLVVTGSHLANSFGLTMGELESDGFASYKKVHLVIDSDDQIAMSKSIGLGIISFTDVFDQLAPDMVLLLGDRYEIFAAASAAYTLRIPIAHIHGGETTQGSLDEGFRHAITKMSSLHFAAAEDYARRIVQMGENSEFVFNFGAPGVEAILSQKLLDLSKMSELIGLKLEASKYVVVAYHPETNDEGLGIHQFKSILTALDKIKQNYKVAFSKSNADPGGRAISALIDEFVEANPACAASFVSLGHLGFTSLLKHSFVMLGNSSSGIIEAPALGIPTINIGNRQAGRIFANSIFQSKPVATDIISKFEAVKSLDSLAFKNLPYGSGQNVAHRILEVLSTVNLDALRRKKFFDK